MKTIFSLALFATLALVPSAQAESNFNGCQINGKIVPFHNFHQEGAARVAYIRLSAHAFVEYQNVYNQASLLLIEDGNVVASNSELMSPVQLGAEVEGYHVSCHANP
jgi:hypothetical protein